MLDFFFFLLEDQLEHQVGRQVLDFPWGTFHESQDLSQSN